MEQVLIVAIPSVMSAIAGIYTYLKGKAVEERSASREDFASVTDSYKTLYEMARLEIEAYRTASHAEVESLRERVAFLENLVIKVAVQSEVVDLPPAILTADVIAKMVDVE